MKNYLKAIVFSNIFDIVVSSILSAMLGYVILWWNGIDMLSFARNPVDYKEFLSQHVVIYSILLIQGATTSLIAGFLAAKWAQRSFLLMGGLSSVLCVVGGIINIISADSIRWLEIGLLLLSPILGVMGGYLFARLGQTYNWTYVKRALLSFAIVVVLVFVGVIVAGPRQSAQNGNGAGTKIQKAQLLAGIKDPFVVHIRNSINNFNSGKEEGFSVIEDFNLYKEYLESKFVLMELNHTATMGGKEMAIIFTDNPDKLFYVWVYKQADGTYDLRSFSPIDTLSAEEANSMYQSSLPLIEELGLAI